MNEQDNETTDTLSYLDSGILASVEDYRKYNKQDVDSDTYNWISRDLLDYSLRGVSTFNIY